MAASVARCNIDDVVDFLADYASERKERMVESERYERLVVGNDRRWREVGLVTSSEQRHAQNGHKDLNCERNLGPLHEVQVLLAQTRELGEHHHG